MRKNLNIAITVSGLKYGSKALKITPISISFGGIKTAFNNAGLTSVSTVEQDLNYNVSSWDKYKEALDMSYKIVKEFPWRKEVFDCDNRSAFINVLMSVYGLTCGRAHGEVYNSNTGDKKYLHWFNAVIDKDLNVYVFDADAGGKFTKIKKDEDIIIENNKYVIDQVIFN